MSLALRKRKGSPFWHARGTVPMRQADGSIAQIRIEESTREVSKARARRFAQDLWDHYRAQAYRPKAKASPSFTDAALTYVESKNPSKRDRQFLAKLVAHFGETPISEIDQGRIAETAHQLYRGATSSTHNRAVFAPIITVLRLSGVRPDFRRPRINRVSVSVPTDEWFDNVFSHCPPQLAALLAFLTLTGRRISEALQAIDNGDGTATIGRTKTGGSVVVSIPALCRDLLDGDGRRLDDGKRLFTYGDRHNVYRELRKVCKRAGVPYYGTHSLGRHAFATRLLKQGRSVKHVAMAGGWASPRMVLERYGHVEKSEVAEDVRRVGEEWGREREKARKSNENND